jgi:anti-sigma-K factor RskA
MVSVIALMAAAAISLVLAIRADRQLNQAGSREQLIARVLTAPDAVMLTAPVMSDGTATVVMSHRDRSLVFTTAGLPPLPNGQCYQLWLMGPRGDRSAGMLPAQHAGMTSPVIASGLAARDWVGLTVEPEGGSSRPTSRPVLMMSLAA